MGTGLNSQEITLQPRLGLPVRWPDANPMSDTSLPNRWRRFSERDELPLRLDKFAREDPAHGFSAFRSPADPKPRVGLNAGKIASMDGVLADDFDMIDTFIA